MSLSSLSSLSVLVTARHEHIHNVDGVDKADGYFENAEENGRHESCVGIPPSAFLLMSSSRRLSPFLQVQRSVHISPTKSAIISVSRVLSRINVGVSLRRTWAGLSIPQATIHTQQYTVSREHLAGRRYLNHSLLQRLAFA